jgi:hypothetical protein
MSVAPPAANGTTIFDLFGRPLRTNGDLRAGSGHQHRSGTSKDTTSVATRSNRQMTVSFDVP